MAFVIWYGEDKKSTESPERRARTVVSLIMIFLLGLLTNANWMLSSAAILIVAITSLTTYAALYNFFDPTTLGFLVVILVMIIY